MIGIGNDDFYQNLAYGSLQKVSQLQTQRDQQNKALAAQRTTNTVGGAAGGAMAGAEIGSSFGPYGAAIGGAIGLVGGALGGHFL